MSPQVGSIKVKKQQLELDMGQQSVSSVIQSCLTFYDPMNCSTPGLPVHHQLPEFTQTHVHWVGDAIRPYHPLSSPSLPALNLSQHQGLFQWDWFQIGKEVHQGCILSPCLFNLYAGYTMWNVGLDETQAGIKIARKITNNLRCADDTTLMADSEDELKSILMKVEEDSEKNWLKTQHSKIKDPVIQPHCFMANRWGNNGNSERLYLGGLQNQMVIASTKLKDTYSLEEKLCPTYTE